MMGFVCYLSKKTKHQEGMSSTYEHDQLPPLVKQSTTSGGDEEHHSTPPRHSSPQWNPFRFDAPPPPPAVRSDRGTSLGGALFSRKRSVSGHTPNSGDGSKAIAHHAITKRHGKKNSGKVPEVPEVKPLPQYAVPPVASSSASSTPRRTSRRLSEVSSPMRHNGLAASSNSNGPVAPLSPNSLFAGQVPPPLIPTTGGAAALQQNVNNNNVVKESKNRVMSRLIPGRYYYGGIYYCPPPTVTLDRKLTEMYRQVCAATTHAPFPLPLNGHPHYASGIGGGAPGMLFDASSPMRSTSPSTSVPPHVSGSNSVKTTHLFTGAAPSSSSAPWVVSVSSHADAPLPVHLDGGVDMAEGGGSAASHIPAPPKGGVAQRLGFSTASGLTVPGRQRRPSVTLDENDVVL